MDHLDSDTTVAQGAAPLRVPTMPVAEDVLFPRLALATVPDRRKLLNVARKGLTQGHRELTGQPDSEQVETLRCRIQSLRLLLGRMKRVLDIYERMYSAQPLLAFLLLPGIESLLSVNARVNDAEGGRLLEKTLADCDHYLRQGVPLAKELGRAIRLLAADPAFSDVGPKTLPDPDASVQTFSHG